MSPVKKHVYKEPFDWATVPTRVLMKAARQRNEEVAKKFGPWSSQKELRPAPCGKPVGARELRRHKRECKKCLLLKKRAA